MLLLGHPGDVYNIGNPRPEISMIDLLHTVGQILGREVPYHHVEYPDTYPGDEPQRRCPDISKAALDLNYQPVVDLPVGLRRYFEWALKHYH